MSVGRNNRNVRTRSYRHCLKTLGANVAELADLAFAEFLRNPQSPILANHPLDDTRRGRHRKESRAVSVTYRYRAIYVVEGDTNVWYWIGTHESYNTFTGRK